MIWYLQTYQKSGKHTEGWKGIKNSLSKTCKSINSNCTRVWHVRLWVLRHKLPKLGVFSLEAIKSIWGEISNLSNADCSSMLFYFHSSSILMCLNSWLLLYVLFPDVSGKQNKWEQPWDPENMVKKVLDQVRPILWQKNAAAQQQNSCRRKSDESPLPPLDYLRAQNPPVKLESPAGTHWGGQDL